MTADMKFAWIPPGTFLMGGNGVESNPQHRVTISKGFWMGVYPVTQAEWQAVMGYNPSTLRGDDRPAVVVSWGDAQEFCQKMAQLVGKPIRLPTEAEWEYACRAGTTSEYWSGNGAEALKKAGWFDGNSDTHTKPVGKLAANPWGLYDVHGNVFEWCQDCSGLITEGNQIDPLINTKVEDRIMRGGASNHPLSDCLAAARNKEPLGKRYNNVGFRVCFRLDG